jgi:hypothetical protein
MGYKVITEDEIQPPQDWYGCFPDPVILAGPY